MSLRWTRLPSGWANSCNCVKADPDWPSHNWIAERDVTSPAGGVPFGERLRYT